MVEIGAGMELKANAEKLVEKEAEADTDFGDISFEELLAQEKKDVFWLVHILNLLSNSTT